MVLCCWINSSSTSEVSNVRKEVKRVTQRSAAISIIKLARFQSRESRATTCASCLLTGFTNKMSNRGGYGGGGGGGRGGYQGGGGGGGRGGGGPPKSRGMGQIECSLSSLSGLMFLMISGNLSYCWCHCYQQLFSTPSGPWCDFRPKYDGYGWSRFQKDETTIGHVVLAKHLSRCLERRYEQYDDLRVYLISRLEFIFDGTSFFSVGEGLPLKAVVLEDKRKSYNVSCVSHVNITLQDSGDNVAQLSQVLNVILKRVCLVLVLASGSLSGYWN